MGTNRVNARSCLLGVVAVALTLLASVAQTDDTDIYRAALDPAEAGRPKVLIIFDDSGSMGTIVPGQRKAYDPNGTYVSAHNSDRIYWSTNGRPPGTDSNRWFEASKNRCAESYAALQTQGFTQTKARRWRPVVLRNNGRVRNAAAWLGLSRNVRNPAHVECQADVINNNPSNGPGVANGFARNTVANPAAGAELGAATAADSNVNWGDQPYSFYSAHYMDWYYDATQANVDSSRMDIAKEVVTTLIKANRDIDFGLALFNHNDGSSDDGGRIVSRIVQNMDDTQRANLTAVVAGLTDQGWTPLCESTYEAYRYLAGDTVKYGLERSFGIDFPPRDTLAEAPIRTYSAPSSDCAYTYIILMTDGRPTRDSDANDEVEALTRKTCGSYANDSGGTSKNCLPLLAEYMANTDLDQDATNGKQYGITYTVGFTTDQELLEDTALKGKGEYYTADNAEELAAAFQSAILSILSTNATFTSPAVAVDTFTRTQSRDDVFFAMFKPTDSVDWAGNIKKLKVKIADGSATLVDSNDEPAIDPGDGQIKNSATSFWSSPGDGQEVLAGGVGELLANRDPATRVIYSNTGTGEALEVFSDASIDIEAFGLDTEAELFEFFGVSDASDLTRAISWNKGFDVDDIDDDLETDDPRPWILADMLHSKPLVINYGARGSFTALEPDLRIVVGTNGGFMHMFGNTDGQEDWAFFAKELSPVIEKRRVNAISSEHVYGIDSPPVVYTRDLNLDGTIDAAAGDKVYLYFGLRRGGRILYAMDISNPDSPRFLWRIDQNSPGFEELGQTWSVPVVTRIPGYRDGDGVPKPVLAFGAGYDLSKDTDGVATPDSMGRGMYLVDAETGALVWSVTPADNTANNLQEIGLEHAVAAGVTALDSNGDELTDRFYFGDTGGTLWRVDLPGNALPTIAQDKWRIVKLASFNGGTVETDRRFFNPPDVVRSVNGGKMVDAVIIGTGDRTDPNDTRTENRLYLVKDEQVRPFFTARPSSADCLGADPVDDFRCQLPLNDSDLFDVTSDALNTGTPAEQTAAAVALANANGWRLDLTASGEKNLARALTIADKVYFTTFSPESEVQSICEPLPGDGRLYVLNLFDASADRNLDGDENDFERFVVIGSLIPDSPSPHFGSDGKIRLLLPPGGSVDPGIGNPMETGSALPPPYGSFWFREEY